jgi:hypothetical protein
MTVYVISTQTNSVSYCRYNKVGGLPILKDKITIWGGAGLPSLKSGFGEMKQDEEGVPMWVADGIVTPVSDENYDILKEHWLFKKHLDCGLVKVIKHDIIGDHKAVSTHVKTMTKRDDYAQATPNDVKNMKVTTTNKPEKEDQFRI